MTNICSVDRRTRIVMRNKKAVQLGIVQFAIFDTLHRVRKKLGKQMLSNELADEIYRGVSDPPDVLNTLHGCVRTANLKLAHLGLKIRGVNRKQNSFYQIVVLS